MKNKFLKYSAGLATAILLLFTSCNEMDLPPTDKFTEGNYWSSTEKANMILNMAYSQMTNSDYFFNSETLSDNLYEGRGSSSEKAISSGQADASNARFLNEWKDCYAGIKTCHIFLENVDRVPNMDADLKARMKAEARFIRAFLYFRLTNWYGDVPLFDHDLTLTEAKSVPRTPKVEVLAFVQSELDAIIDQLPAKGEYAADDTGRITSGAVAALKARIYLYDNDWTNVVTWCDKLINTSDYGTYSLFPSYEGLFLPENENNSEVILDLSYIPIIRTWSNFRDVVPVSVGKRVNSYSPTQELVNDYIMLNGKTITASGSNYSETDPYKNRDPRFTATVVYHGYQWKKPDGTFSTIYIKPGTYPRLNPNDPAPDEYNGQGTNTTATGYYLRKYYDPTSLADLSSGLNLILIRYADVLLMYAEAKNELGQMDQNTWNMTIRALRTRAGFTDPEALVYNGALSKTDLQDIIRRERRSELAIEGTRIHDLRRWKTAEVVLNGYPHGAQYGDISIDNGYIRLDKRTFNKDRDYLWAIPQSEKDINPGLGQNPNY